MAAFTLDHLNRILGREPGVLVAGHEVDRTFADLGVDSLALVELTERLIDEHDIPAPGDIHEELGTPGLVLAYVNRHVEMRRDHDVEECAGT
ncbi:phosphopantetheine-binding protein [Nonomuraea sp. SBT364]|uniref:phosphopantetheine-binding protein n=1 Tax=Nonomuraea sp. SBT364 TaxID=1580530 RepID=UPI00066AFCA9|nr:phosphopantetheine-binding protein [Nonomuraea sp. SBT364]